MRNRCNTLNAYNNDTGCHSDKAQFIKKYSVTYCQARGQVSRFRGKNLFWRGKIFFYHMFHTNFLSTTLDHLPECPHLTTDLPTAADHVTRIQSNNVYAQSKTTCGKLKFGQVLLTPPHVGVHMSNGFDRLVVVQVLEHQDFVVAWVELSFQHRLILGKFGRAVCRPDNVMCNLRCQIVWEVVECHYKGFICERMTWCRLAFATTDSMNQPFHQTQIVRGEKRTFVAWVLRPCCQSTVLSQCSNTQKAIFTLVIFPQSLMKLFLASKFQNSYCFQELANFDAQIAVLEVLQNC